MPRRQKNPPLNEPFLKLGKITIERLDALNWSVAGEGSTAYYGNLGSAIRYAAGLAADSKSKTAIEWLLEYRKIAEKVAHFSQVIQNKELSRNRDLKQNKAVTLTRSVGSIGRGE